MNPVHEQCNNISYPGLPAIVKIMATFCFFINNIVYHMLRLRPCREFLQPRTGRGGGGEGVSEMPPLYVL